MKNTFRLFFIVKKAKMIQDGSSPIFMRIKIEDATMEIFTRRHVIPASWNGLAQKAKGSTDEIRSLNDHLKNMEREIYAARKSMEELHIPFTVFNLKRFVQAKDDSVRGKMLIKIFQNHNNQVKALIGKEYAKVTHVRYEMSLKHTVAFLQWKYQVSDININRINHEFISSYDFYLRSEKNCANNSTVKYIKNFKKIIRICIANGWLDKDPFVNYKAKLKEVVREFLTPDEIATMSEKVFSYDRLTQVRDIFIFSCYTGLAYVDVMKLKRSEVSIGIDGQQWIFTSRQKTDTASRIPMLPVAQAIMDKYATHPECIDKGKVLPVLSNQKMNSYLKEVADFCGITKPLTFHIARHTFATTVTLSNGVPIETVSKMLGHKNLKTTQHYAKILDSKVGLDMLMLRKKLSIEHKEDSQGSAKNLDVRAMN